MPSTTETQRDGYDTVFANWVTFLLSQSGDQLKFIRNV